MQMLEKHFDLAFSAPDGIKKLRELILTLAMQGKLVPQDPNDQPACELLKKIESEKNQVKVKGGMVTPKTIGDSLLESYPFEIPKSWKWVRLGEIVSILGDGIHGTPSYDDHGEYYFINGNNLNDGAIQIKEGTKRVNFDEYQKHKKNLNNRTVLVSINGTIGNVAFFNSENVMLGKSACYFNLFEKIEKNYIKRLINSKYFLEYANSSATGSTIKNVSLKSMREFFVPLPPTEEQQRIVNKIDQLMARCDELEKLRDERNQKRITVHTAALNRLLTAQATDEFTEARQFIAQHFSELYTVKENVTELRKAILQLAVMGKLVQQDPNDQPASELLKEIAIERQKMAKTIAKESINRDEEYLGRPLGWEYCRLGNLAKFIDYRGKTPKKVEAGIPLITAKNIRYGYINREPYEFIETSEYDNWMTRGLPKIGDLLFTTEAPLGNIAVIDIRERFALAQRVICFQLHNPAMAHFLKYLIMSEVFQIQLLNKATGMTATGIKASLLKEIPIPIPPILEQQRIVNKIDQLMNMCDELDSQIDAKTFKQASLLNALVSVNH